MCDCSTSSWGSDTRLIYRHYATLYFVFVVDQQESELGILDLVQGTQPGRSLAAVSGATDTCVGLAVFVETLDKCFENVCELDLIFHSDKVGAHAQRCTAGQKSHSPWLAHGRCTTCWTRL